MFGHRRSIRLAGYDYASPGSYFVTLLTHMRACVFGRIVNDEMRLSSVGQIARDCWLRIPEHMPGVRLDSWVIMPNHLHGILVIEEGDRASRGGVQDTIRASRGSPLRMTATDELLPRGAPAGSLGAIIAQYKGASGRLVNKLLRQPGARVWHRDYHDHVIRHEDALNRIRRYIELNPSRWYRDRNNPGRLAA
jgi:putative transposase